MKKSDLTVNPTKSPLTNWLIREALAYGGTERMPLPSRVAYGVSTLCGLVPKTNKTAEVMVAERSIRSPQDVDILLKAFEDNILSASEAINREDYEMGNVVEITAKRRQKGNVGIDIRYDCEASAANWSLQNMHHVAQAENISKLFQATGVARPAQVNRLQERIALVRK